MTPALASGMDGSAEDAGAELEKLLGDALDRAVRLNPADPNPYLNLAWLTLVMPQDSDTLKNAEIYYRQAIKRGAARDRALESRIGLTKW